MKPCAVWAYHTATAIIPRSCRVAIARAIVSRPGLILADEPTGNLDSKNGSEVINLLSQLHREGATIVMVTHSTKDASHADYIINLFDGQVVENLNDKM